MRIHLKKILNSCAQFVFVILIGAIFYNLYWHHKSNKITTWFELSSNFSDNVQLNSYCICRPNITIKKHNFYENVYKKDDYYIVFEKDSQNKSILQSLEKDLQGNHKIFINPKFTCDLNQVFTHGPNKKVMGFSLYGKNPGYSNLFELIAQQAKLLFPDWIIRIYYDDSIDKSIICNLECKYDTIYFCNVNKIPFSYVNNIDLFKTNYDNHVKSMISNDLSYVHGMMWRWFPITDDFVDFFSSRDSDSTLIQREKDSVDEWLNSNTLFHIMRDNPWHNTVILGGMWGYANHRNRELGYRIYKEFINATGFNPNKLHLKGADQSYLATNVWLTARENATIHDSYGCLIYGGKPFPSRRPENLYCFVTCFNPCCDPKHNQTQRMPVCPEKCRLKPEWDRC